MTYIIMKVCLLVVANPELILAFLLFCFTGQTTGCLYCNSHVWVIRENRMCYDWPDRYFYYFGLEYLSVLRNPDTILSRFFCILYERLENFHLTICWPLWWNLNGLSYLLLRHREENFSCHFSSFSCHYNC